MKAYSLSLGAGVLVGVVYSLLGVRSLAPPVVALVSLLGTLIGEQVSAARRQSDCSRQLFGSLPGLQAPGTIVAAKIPEIRS